MDGAVVTDILEELCTAGRQLEALGLSPGSSGNISVRVGDELQMSPTGVALGSLVPGELSVLSPDGQDGYAHVRGPRPSKEVALHDVFYRSDPEARCVIHLHSTYAVAASCLPAWSAYSALPPVTPYLLMRVGNIPLVPYAPPGDVVQARSLLDLDLQFHAALLQNHGPVVAGSTVAEALARAVEVEEAAKIALALGHRADVRLLDEQEAAVLSARYGQPWGPAAPTEPPTDRAATTPSS
jgi:ribulose-5-phosphate 4-epimerase/fuculose-1-phosphate aldolase